MRDWSQHRAEVMQREMATCQKQGRDAARKGLTLTDNPYRPSANQPIGYRKDLIAAWDEGFTDAVERCEERSRR